MDADREAEAGPKDDRKMQFFFFVVYIVLFEKETLRCDVSESW